MKEKPDNGIVVVDGYLVQPSLPSEALIMAGLREQYKDVVHIQKLIQTLPNKYLNKFKTLRRKVYLQLLQRYTVKIVAGWYLLPAKMLTDFQAAKNEIIKEYEKFENDIRKYLKNDHEYTTVVKEIAKVRRPSIVNRINIRLIPLQIDPRLFEQYVDEKSRAALSEVDTEKARLLEQTKREIEATRTQMLESAVNDLQERLDKITEKIAQKARTQLTKRGINALHQQLEQLNELAEATKSQRISSRINAAHHLLNLAEQGRIEETGTLIDGDISPRMRAALQGFVGE